MKDNTNPEHYKTHPSGIECIEITQHYDFNIGNAIKYLWRAGLKGSETEDLKKAIWYINNKIKLLDSANNAQTTIKEVECIGHALLGGVSVGRIYHVISDCDYFYRIKNDYGNIQEYAKCRFKIHEPK